MCKTWGQHAVYILYDITSSRTFYILPYIMWLVTVTVSCDWVMLSLTLTLSSKNRKMKINQNKMKIRIRKWEKAKFTFCNLDTLG